MRNPGDPREVPCASPEGLKPGRPTYPFGLTAILGPGNPTGMRFDVARLAAGQSIRLEEGSETAVLLLGGSVRLECDGERWEARRDSLFDQDGFAFHMPALTSASVTGTEECELAVVRVDGGNAFRPRAFFRGDYSEVEERCPDAFEGTAHRVVKAIFDSRNRPEAQLVLGEVINLPGRWSSYPPHHHPQPEIYHYRFTDPRGYGHAELGDRICKVRQGDTLVITDGLDHPQVAAPGYGMWYLWAIRHLPGDPYVKPVFARDHAWLNDPDARYWRRPGASGESAKLRSSGPSGKEHV